LGLNAAGLERVSAKFALDRYKGAFASGQRPRWWVAAIRATLEELVGRRVAGPASVARHDLLRSMRIKNNRHSEFFSRAHGHQGFAEVPDCVAYRDDQREEGDRVQALFVETHVDERDANPPFGFEARRVYGVR
jgi:hypothetical protein